MFESMKIIMQPCTQLKVLINIQETHSVPAVFLSRSQAVSLSDG